MDEPQDLQVEIQKGIDQLDAGQGIDGELVFAELREKARKLSEPANSMAGSPAQRIIAPLPNDSNPPSRAGANL